MRSFITCAALLPFLSPTAFALTVSPETVTEVNFSNRDVNRVVCSNGNINDAFFSAEKGIQLTTSGSNAFVKFQIREDGYSSSYVTVRSEFYIVCDGTVYTLMVTPKEIPGQTVHLSSGTTKNIQKNIELLSPLPDEERAVMLTMKALEDNSIPESFTITPNANPSFVSSPIRGTDVALRRTIRVEGMGLKLSEYYIRANQKILFNETDFLSPAFGSNIFAVTVDPQQIAPGQTGRVFIVNREVE